MIFITLGSQKFQFNRLLIEIDRLIEDGEIKEEIFAQIGYSDYKPKNYKFREFLNRDEFTNMMNKCDKVITHGGTGAIIGAVKKEKKVIAIPRLKEFNEHVDNHQKEIVNQFNDMNLILGVTNLDKLTDVLKELNQTTLSEYISNTDSIINSIDKFITKC